MKAVVETLANALSGPLAAGFRIVRVAAEALGSFFTDALPQGFGAVTAGAKAVAGILSSVLHPAFSGVKDVVQELRDLFEWFKGAATTIWAGIAKKLPSLIAPITATFQGLNSVLQSIIGAMRWILDKVDEVADAVGKAAGVVGKVKGLIPGRAAGGPVSMGQAYIVGESGPELFVPGRMGTIIPSLHVPDPLGMTRMPSPMPSPAPSQTTINVNLHGTNIGTSREFQDVVRRAFYDVQRRNPGSGL